MTAVFVEQPLVLPVSAKSKGGGQEEQKRRKKEENTEKSERI